MTSRVAPLLAALGIVAGLALAGVVLHAGDRQYAVTPNAERFLYLKSGRAASRLMLSFDALAADVYWIRTIQHYGRDRKSPRATGRFELLYPMLSLTTTLDPYFNIAYRFGAIFLAQPAPLGPDRVDQAIALLEKGLASDPNHWTYALDIGFIYYWYGTGGPNAPADFTTAAQWFDRAAGMPGAPAWLRPLAAVTRAQGGDRTGARKMLGELAQSEEPWIRRAAERGLQQIQALDDIDTLQRLANQFVASHRAAPTSWADLGVSGRVADPTGAPYEYDAIANRIRLSPQSSLQPLPQTLRSK